MKGIESSVIQSESQATDTATTKSGSPEFEFSGHRPNISFGWSLDPLMIINLRRNLYNKGRDAITEKVSTPGTKTWKPRKGSWLMNTITNNSLGKSRNEDNWKTENDSRQRKGKIARQYGCTWNVHVWKQSLFPRGRNYTDHIFFSSMICPSWSESGTGLTRPRSFLVLLWTLR